MTIKQKKVHFMSQLAEKTIFELELENGENVTKNLCII